MITQKTENPFWNEVARVLAGKPEPDHAVDFAAWRAWYRDKADQWGHRDLMCRKYAWAVADPASCDFVAKWLGRHAIEIGAGNGYWAWQLYQRGIDIFAYDKAPPDQVVNDYFCPRKDGEWLKETTHIWFPVHRGTPEILAEHTDRTLFLCWPTM